MRLRHTFAVFGLSVLVISVDAQDDLKSTILANETRELECLRSSKLAEFADLLAEDAVFVDSHGPASKTEVVRNTAEFRLQDFTMEDVRFVPLSSKSGILIYKVTETALLMGRHFQPKFTFPQPGWSAMGNGSAFSARSRLPRSLSTNW